MEKTLWVGKIRCGTIGGKCLVTITTVVDEKGRIVVPKLIRKELRITEGSRVTVQVEEEKLVVSKAVEPKEFIHEMEGFVQMDSLVPLVDPISMKRIWEKT